MTSPATAKILRMIKQLPPEVREEIAELTLEDLMRALARAREAAAARSDVS